MPVNPFSYPASRKDLREWRMNEFSGKAPQFIKHARRRFGNSHIAVLSGTSKDIFPELLPTLSGDICFWLDGQYLDGQYLADKTPKDDSERPVRPN